MLKERKKKFLFGYTSLDKDFCLFLYTWCSVIDVMAEKVLTADNYLPEHHFKIN